MFQEIFDGFDADVEGGSGFVLVNVMEKNP
jgi:hypothetical protein